MPKIVRTAKGEKLDFDLMKIKQQIAAGPTPLEVKERKNFIDNKLQRRIKKAQSSIARKAVAQEEPKNAIVELEKAPQPVATTVTEGEKEITTISVDALAALAVPPNPVDELDENELEIAVEKPKTSRKIKKTPKATK